MKLSDPAPLYKNAGIKARGKDTGNPVLLSRVTWVWLQLRMGNGMALRICLRGWVLWKRRQKKRNWKNTERERRKQRGREKTTDRDFQS